MQKKMMTRREEEEAICFKFNTSKVLVCVRLNVFEMKGLRESCVVFIDLERLGN